MTHDFNDLAHELWAMAQGPQPVEDAVRAIAARLTTTQGAAPPTAVAPDRRGVYAWVSRDGHAALVHVNTRQTDHSPGGVLNASVIESTKFYDGCAVENWGKDGRWVLLHAFDEAIASTQPSAALTSAPAEPVCTCCGCGGCKACLGGPQAVPQALRTGRALCADGAHRTIGAGNPDNQESRRLHGACRNVPAGVRPHPGRDSPSGGRRCGCMAQQGVPDVGNPSAVLPTGQSRRLGAGGDQ